MHSDDLGRRLGHSHETRKTSAFYILNFFDGQSLRFPVQVRAGDERFRCPFGFATPGTHDRDDDYHRVRRCNLGAEPIRKRFQIANFFQSKVVPVQLAAEVSKQLGGLSSSKISMCVAGAGSKTVVAVSVGMPTSPEDKAQLVWK